MESCAGDSVLVDDIEDLLVPAESQRLAKKDVVTRVVKRNGETHEVPSGESHIPGTQSVYLRTWGCAHNNSDSEYMAGLLAAYGYRIVAKGDAADLWLLNSCTVKNPAEDHFRNAITEGRKAGKALVLAGCVPQGAPNTGYLRDVSVVGVQQIDRVVEVVEETLKGNTVRLLAPRKRPEGGRAGGADLALPKIRRNPLIEILAINTGCLNACTYCKTKHARGVLASYPVEEIVARAVQAFNEGVVELWLTSEDLGAYGRDIGANLPILLRQLVQVIPEDCMMRLGMTNPPYILEHLPEMAEILAHPRVYAFLHVPVQSGSDNVLGEMRREYTVAEFSHVVDTLRAAVPGLTVATDLICGFPTETDEDFEDTMRLVRKYHFPSLFINQFFPRPGTPAARMPRVASPAEVKQRTKRVSELFHSYRTYDHKLGERQRILITEISHDKKHFVGHNKFYEQVLVPQQEGLMGRVAEVHITECGKHFMKAEIISSASINTSTVASQIEENNVFGPERVARIALGLTVGLLIGRMLHKSWRRFCVD